MSDENQGDVAVMEAPASKPAKASKPKVAKKPAAKPVAPKGNPVKAVKKPGKKANDAKNYVSKDGTERGIRRPDSWKPEKPRMAKYLEAQAEGKKGIELAPFMNPSQMRVLTLLSTAKGPVASAEFLEEKKVLGGKKAIADAAYVGVWVGRTDPETRAESEKRWGYVSLITMGCVKAERLEDNDKKYWGYTITPQGRKWLEKKQKADAAKKDAKDD